MQRNFARNQKIPFLSDDLVGDDIVCHAYYHDIRAAEEPYVLLASDAGIIYCYLHSILLKKKILPAVRTDSPLYVRIMIQVVEEIFNTSLISLLFTLLSLLLRTVQGCGCTLLLVGCSTDRSISCQENSEFSPENRVNNQEKRKHDLCDNYNYLLVYSLPSLVLLQEFSDIGAFSVQSPSHPLHRQILCVSQSECTRMRLTEIKNGFVFPNNFILNSIENNGSESSGKNGSKSDVDYNSGHGNNTDNNNNNEECSMASKMNMNIEETTDEKKRKSKNKKEKKDKKDKKRKHKDIILNNNDDTNNNTKNNNDSNNDNNDNYNHDLNRSIDAGGESNVSVKKAKTKHPVPVPPSTTRVPYGTVRAPFSSLSLSEDRLSSVLQALKRGLLKTQLSVNSEENRVTNRLAVLAGVRNRVRALVLTPCTFNTAPSTVRTSFLNSSVTLQDLVKKMSPLFSVKHSDDHSWNDKNKNENKNINKNKNKNENILGIRNIPPSVSARTTHDCTYDVTVLESVYEHRSDGEGGRGGIMVYLKIKNTSMLPVFNLHADALQITLPSSTSSSPTPSSFSSFSSSFSTSIGLTSISGSVSLLEPQQTVTLSFSFYLPQRVFTGCRDGSDQIALTVNIFYKSLKDSKIIQMKPNLTKNFFDVNNANNFRLAEKCAKISEIICSDSHRSCLEVATGWLETMNRGIAATVLILRLKEFDLISKQNETTNSRRKDENKNKNKNKNIAEFEDDLSDDFSTENVDKYFKSFLITKNTAVQQRTKYLKIDDESSKNKNNNSGNRETNKNRNRNRNRNLEGDEVLNFFVKSEKVFSPTLKLNFMLLERTSSTVRLWRSSSSRNNDSTSNIKNDGNNGNSHDTNDNRNDDSNSSGSKDKQDNCDKNNCNKNNCNINNENKNNSCLGLMTVIQGVKKYFNFNFNSKGCIVISDKEVISKKKIFDCYSDNDDYANKNINKNIPNNNNRVTVLNVGSSFFSIYFAATDIRIENGFRGEGNTSKEFRYCKLAQHTNTKNCFNFTDSVSSLDRSLSLLENVVTDNEGVLVPVVLTSRTLQFLRLCAVYLLDELQCLAVAWRQKIARRNFADNANKIIRDKINDNTDFYSDLLQINSELNVRTALGSELMKKIVRSDTLMATLLENNQAFL